MKRSNLFFFTSIVLATGALAAAQGCGGESSTSTGTGGTSATTTASTTTTGTGGSTTTGTGGGTTTGTGGTMMPPPPPSLGAQIDRFGRPAINTATNHTFDVDAAKKNAAKDTWNQQADQTKWSNYAGDVAASIAVIDGLDTVCGNQLLAGPNPVAGRYAGLAGVLADDRVWVRTDAASCGVYLAVEAAATGIIPNMDCGGRKLDYDVIDISYSALAVGAISGVGDGVAADADTKGEAFPYAAAPH